MAVFAYGGSWIAGSMTQEELNIAFPNGIDDSEDSVEQFCSISPEFCEFFNECNNPLFVSSPANETDGIVLCFIDTEIPIEVATEFRRTLQEKAQELCDNEEYDKAEMFAFTSTIFTICIIKDDPKYQNITEELDSDDFEQLELTIPYDRSKTYEQLEQPELPKRLDKSEYKRLLDNLVEFVKEKRMSLDQMDPDQRFVTFLEKLKYEANNLGIPSICFTTKDVNKLRFFLQHVKMPVHTYLDRSVYYVFMDADHADHNELSSSMFVAFEAGLQMEPIGRYLAIREHKKELSEEVIQLLMEP